MSNAGVSILTTRDRLDPYLWPLGGALLLLSIYAWLFWDFLSTQVTWAWREQADWGHTLVIPVIAAYFVYLKRRELLARPFRTTWVGLVPIVLGVAWYTVTTLNEAARHHNLQGLGVWISLTGLTLLFFGFRAMRYLWIPLLYVLFFGQSISDRAMSIITYRLQDIAAQGSYAALVLVGVDVDVSGNTLTIYDGQGMPRPLNIAEACSGMRMLMAFLALGAAMAYTGLPRLWQQAILVILAFPTAVFVNILRVVTLAMLTRYDVEFAAGDFHSFIGLVWLVPALFIYLGLMWIIRHFVVEPDDV